MKKNVNEIILQFKNSLVLFLDELINQLPLEGDLVIIRIFLKDRASIIDIINYFITKILPLKNMIKDRDEDFFLDKCNIFDSIKNEKQIDKINYFKKIWTTIDYSDKKIVWDWFDYFIIILEKYINNN